MTVFTPEKGKPSEEETDKKIEDFKSKGYTLVSGLEAIESAIHDLPMGTRVAYVTKKDYKYTSGAEVGRRVRPGGWMIAKADGKRPVWFSLQASNGARVTWSVQCENLESILHRPKNYDNKRQPSEATMKRYKRLQDLKKEEAS